MKEITLEELYQKGLEMHHITNTAYPLTPVSFMRYKIKDSEEIKKLLKEDIAKLDALSLYVHVPFCKADVVFVNMQ